MKNKKINSLTETALLTALIFVSTKLINIPTPVGGVINLVDAVILTISLLVSRRSAVFASGIGSFISELLSPYAIFAPATLLIKSLMAFTSNTLFHKLKYHENIKILIAFISAEIIMIVGYFIYQAFFLSLGIYTASLDIINNITQASISIVFAIILYKALKPLFKWNKGS